MPAVSFVADDLTGAADVLAQAHRYGLDAVLVLGGGDTHCPPTPTSSGSPAPRARLGGAAFDELVRAQLAQIARTGAEVLLYKVCSTFDSLPTLGSIGSAASSCCTSSSPGSGPSPSHPPNRSSAATPPSATTSGSSPARSTAWTGTR